MKITITEDDMTVHVHTEEIPPVALVKDEEYSTELLAIGQRSIDHKEGGNIEQFDRNYYQHQLLDAIAAIRFFDVEDEQ